MQLALREQPLGVEVSGHLDPQAIDQHAVLTLCAGCLESCHLPLSQRCLRFARDERRQNRRGMVRAHQAFGTVAKAARVAGLPFRAFGIRKRVRRIDRFDAGGAALQYEAASRVVELNSLRGCARPSDRPRGLLHRAGHTGHAATRLRFRER